jgi:hypothetical protein
MSKALDCGGLTVSPPLHGAGIVVLSDIGGSRRVEPRRTKRRRAATQMRPSAGFVAFARANLWLIAVTRTNAADRLRADRLSWLIAIASTDSWLVALRGPCGWDRRRADRLAVDYRRAPTRGWAFPRLPRVGRMAWLGAHLRQFLPQLLNQRKKFCSRGVCA